MTIILAIGIALLHNNQCTDNFNDAACMQQFCHKVADGCMLVEILIKRLKTSLKIIA